jgi:hypothetical protein
LTIVITQNGTFRETQSQLPNSRLAGPSADELGYSAVDESPPRERKCMSVMERRGELTHTAPRIRRFN